jgi:hypothetical protein
MKKWGFGPGFAMKILAHDLNPNRKLSVCKQLLKSKDNPLKEAKTNQLLKNWKQVLMSAKIARLRNQDKHFQKWELKRLDKAYQKTRKNPEVRSKDIAMLAQNLDIVSVNVPQICTRLGVNVTGKRRKSSGGIKV